MHAQLLELDALHADETTLQVLSEPDWLATSTSYMWLYRSGQADLPIVLYDYQQTRASKHPPCFLESFQGYLHVDGYLGYSGLPDIGHTHVATSRRRCAHYLNPQLQQPGQRQKAWPFVINFFAIDRDLKNISLKGCHEKRL